MTVDNFIRRCMTRDFVFVIEDDMTGKIILPLVSYYGVLDKLYYDEYSKVKDCEVLHWGIHNSRPSTIILYV